MLWGKSRASLSSKVVLKRVAVLQNIGAINFSQIAESRSFDVLFVAGRVDKFEVVRHTTFMIESFADKRTEQIFAGEQIQKLDVHLQASALRRLQYINAAERLEDLRVPPPNRPEWKVGDLQENYAICVNAQWRIIFRWSGNGAHDVQFIDYH